MDLIPLPALILAGILLGLVLAAPVSAIVRWQAGEPVRRIALSTGLFGLTGLQLVTGLLLLDTTWPLTGYPMYAVPIPAGTPVEVLHLTGTTRDGAEMAIPGTAMFADPLDLQARMLPALRDSATQASVAAHLVAYYNAREPVHSRQLVGLQGTVEWRGLAPDGTISSTQEPLFRYRAGAR
jgi:hypothetical protein